MPNEKNLNTIPVGTLGLIPLESCATLGQKVNQYLTEWRAERSHAQSTALHFSEYSKDSYIVKAKNPRFGSGEAKGVIEESVRGCDLYLMVDVCNYSQTYSLCGYVNHMSPDDHYQDLKRIIAVFREVKRSRLCMTSLSAPLSQVLDVYKRQDMSRTIGMALAGFGAIMLTALIWLYLRSKKA